MPHQEPLTVVAKVDPTRLASLAHVMDAMRHDPAHNDVLPFGALPDCHFGRVLFLPESEDLQGRAIAPQLLMLSDCDGPVGPHLEALVDRAQGGIDRLFGNCEDFPKLNGQGASRAQRLDFLRKKSVHVKASYVHRPGRSVEQIRREAQLRDALETFVDAHGLTNLAPLEARKQLRAHVKSTPALSWALEPAPGVDLGYRIRNALDAATLPLGLIAFGPVVLPAALVLLILIRLQELRDPAPHIRPTPEHVRELAALEDFVAQSGYTAGGLLKPGWVRRATVATLLPVIGWGTRHLFSSDSLAGVTSIHFARWIPLDQGRRVVFVSNYDGSVESYNNDFIDLVSWGLNLIFSNGYQYPKTQWLVQGGATREQEFKDYLRRHQIPTPVWYSAYPQLTAPNVVRNAKLRAGLHGYMSESEARRWLKLL